PTSAPPTTRPLLPRFSRPLPWRKGDREVMLFGEGVHLALALGEPIGADGARAFVHLVLARPDVAHGWHGLVQHGCHLPQLLLGQVRIFVPQIVGGVSHACMRASDGAIVSVTIAVTIASASASRTATLPTLGARSRRAPGSAARARRGRSPHAACPRPSPRG